MCVQNVCYDETDMEPEFIQYAKSCVQLGVAFQYAKSCAQLGVHYFHQLSTSMKGQLKAFNSSMTSFS